MSLNPEIEVRPEDDNAELGMIELMIWL